MRMGFAAFPKLCPSGLLLASSKWESYSKDSVGGMSEEVWSGVTFRILTCVPCLSWGPSQQDVPGGRTMPNFASLMISSLILPLEFSLTFCMYKSQGGSVGYLILWSFKNHLILEAHGTPGDVESLCVVPWHFPGGMFSRGGCVQGPAEAHGLFHPLP